MRAASTPFVLAVALLAGCSGSSENASDADDGASADALAPASDVPSDIAHDRVSPPADTVLTDAGVPSDAARTDAAIPLDAPADATARDTAATDVTLVRDAADSSVVDAIAQADVTPDTVDATAVVDAITDVVDASSVVDAGADAVVVDASTDVTDASADAVVDAAPSCVSPAVVCGNACATLATDPHHCGACDTVCPTDETCTSGACACASFQVTCGGSCVDTARDRLHCGDCAIACGTGTACFSSACGVIEAVSAGGNLSSSNAAVSDDARYVAMQSYATNFVTGDTNGRWDIFVRDRATRTWERVSLASDGVTEGNNDSINPSLSADGSVVVFQSTSSNLVANDVNANNDVFAYDRTTHVLTRVTPGLVTAGEFADGQHVSGDGRFVVFRTNGAAYLHGGTRRQAVLFDRTSGTYELLSAAPDGGPGLVGDSSFPVPSYDARYVAFETAANNLVTGDTNATSDVVVRDRQTGTTERVSVASDGTEANGASRRPQISRDGRYVAFQSDATNLVAGDTNGFSDVYLHDRTTHTTTRVSIRGDGVQPNGNSMPTGVSSAGRVVFYCEGTNFVVNDTGTGRDVLVWDVGTAAFTTVSARGDGTVAGAFSQNGAITPDGSYVAFDSNANNDLVSGVSGTQVYLRYVGP